MSKSSIRLYLIFIVVFSAMHLTGAAVSGLPYIFNALITFSVVMILLIVLDKWYSKLPVDAVLKNLGIREAKLTKIVPGIIISIILLLAYPLIGFVLGADIILNVEWFPNLAGLFLTGGLSEEMFFRGFLFRHLRENMSFRKAALVSMVLFAAIHLLMFTYMEFSISLFSTMLAVVISIPMAYLFEAGKNAVWSPAILHTTIRTIGLVVTFQEEFFMKAALLWMVCSMIIPFAAMMLDKNFWKIWRGTVND